ncbi:aromatic-ring hydroxylase C-terminal domain-containing protein [Saccharopolyspora sp. 5N708]|uniref:aromatic-ring hydroxylase C-terminal domain-containing protein n=1 Tax=Saccharopolyspora sp. 5N708 TaxID=3457424 RepID=UPI003FD4A772
MLAAGGFQDPAGALVGGPAEGGEVEPVTDFAPAGRVGTRIPHRWLDADHTLSTVDLGGPGWALAVADDPRRWQQGGRPVHRLDVDFLHAGEGLLLRPDDVVAWRGTDPTTSAAVRGKLLHP